MVALIPATKRSKCAFSLIEVLVTIAVIGVFSGIALTVINKVQGTSEEATAKRQAQLVASMAANAIHAGDTILTGAGDKETAIKHLAAGVYGSGGFSEVHFRLDLSEREQEQTLPYLEYVDGRLKAVLNPD